MSDLMSTALATARCLEDGVGSVLRGQADVVRRVLACMASGGHVLLEDFPGTGKTTLAKAIAACIEGADFSRVQFTPDLLPSDILGVSVLDPRQQEFRFHPGPIFTDILLADEINRASPRTQSALLEAMAEGQVTVEGTRYDFSDRLFFVIATQNPVEFRGTYPLPEAQMDRFAMQCALGYVSAEEEAAILLEQRQRHPLLDLRPVVTREEMLALCRACREVRVTAELRDYIVALVSATRKVADVQLPASPRASIALMKVAQAVSLFEGRDFLLPETVQDLAADVIAHRMVMQPEARFSGRDRRAVVAEILQATPVPV